MTLGGPEFVRYSHSCAQHSTVLRKILMPQSSIQLPCAAVLFDMDGVLIDSTPAVARVWRHWAIDHGFDPDEVVSRAHGRPSLTTVREYLPDSDYVAENRVVEQREIEDLEGVVPLPGSLELLSALPSDRWTIVTSATLALAQVRLRSARLPVPHRLITASDVTHGKPHPEPYLKAAQALSFAAAQCVVVEDVPAGIQSGRAAGAKVIAVTTTVPATALQQAGADWIVQNCSSIRLLDSTAELKLCLTPTA